MIRNPWRPATPRPGALVAIAAATLAVGGCAQDMSDLRQYVNRVESEHQGHVAPLPEVEPYQTFAYEAAERRDPFARANFRERQQSASGESEIRPDPERAKEPLEGYPLDSLRMVGTLSQERELWGLVQSPDGTIYRVQTGNYLGQNNGKIIQIGTNEIAVTEIVPDGMGGWRRRGAAIGLASNSNKQ
ncbi:MAG: pilus assembly protein PilP [Gammaproteobacteria bacterium]|nr:pilus assembly protein PilP [Gammaproteobacteria bacterium]NIR59126.1 pilus assembly protein PilP [Gammaproteobacteria bacterium]